MSYETGWCDDCQMPIGLGPCAGCCAYACVCADLGEEEFEATTWQEEED
jgi:hypothetical protein